MKKLILFSFLILLGLWSCKKPVTQPNSGIYRGSFFQIYNGNDTNAQGIAYLALTKGNSAFQMSGDTASGAPVSCYGTYEILSSTQIKFVNSADIYLPYQPHYVLNATYEYFFDDHKFNLTLIDGIARYEYFLVRD